MNELKAWHTHVQTKGGKELKKRWNSAVTFFAENKGKIATMRGHFGGHFPENIAADVIKKMTANQSGSIELDIDEEAETAGVKLHFCTDLLLEFCTFTTTKRIRPTKKSPPRAF